MATTLFIYLLLGVFFGWIYAKALSVNMSLYFRSRRRALAVTFQLLRLGVTAVFVVGLARHGVWQLVAALGGFTAARLVVVRSGRPRLPP